MSLLRAIRLQRSNCTAAPTRMAHWRLLKSRKDHFSRQTCRPMIVSLLTMEQMVIKLVVFVSNKVLKKLFGISEQAFLCGSARKPLHKSGQRQWGTGRVSPKRRNTHQTPTWHESSTEVNLQNSGPCFAIGKYSTKRLALEDKHQVRTYFTIRAYGFNFKENRNWRELCTQLAKSPKLFRRNLMPRHFTRIQKLPLKPAWSTMAVVKKRSIALSIRSSLQFLTPSMASFTLAIATLLIMPTQPVVQKRTSSIIGW